MRKNLQLLSAAGAAAELAEDAPGLESGVGTFARTAWAGMGAVGSLLGLGFVPALARGDHLVAGLVVAVVALVGQGDQPGVAQRGEDVPDPGGRGVAGAARQLA
ncbi:hypothetical protein GCM10009634_84320 [Saccharothrix xinjiangensis]